MARSEKRDLSDPAKILQEKGKNTRIEIFVETVGYKSIAEAQKRDDELGEIIEPSSSFLKLRPWINRTT